MNTRRRASALWSLALLAVLAGCSDDPSSTGGDGGAGATGTGGSGAAGGMMGTGGMGGMADDAYEQAIRAASWVEISGAPSVSGGAKNDDIFFFDDDHGFLASGNDHAIYETQDGGASWATAFSATGAYFRAVTFTDAMTGFAGNIGAGLAPSINDPNPIYGTSDGGATWSPVTISGEAPAGICNFTSAPDGTLFGVGRANGPTHLATSSDGGATWSSVSLSSWLSMAIDARFTSADEGLVVGMGPGSKCTVIRTSDGGATFDTVFSSTASGSLCWKINFPTDDVGYVAIQQTTLGPSAFAKTTDGGATWQELPLPDMGAYPALAAGFITADIGWMVSEDPLEPAYRTYDGGATWEEDPSLKAPINRFRFVDVDTAYAVGAKVYKLQLDYTPSN